MHCRICQNRLIQTSQTGGQWYSDTSPVRIPWWSECIKVKGIKTSQKGDQWYSDTSPFSIPCLHPRWRWVNRLYDYDNFCFYLQNRLIQTSQTGDQWYSNTSPFSIPCHAGIEFLFDWCGLVCFGNKNKNCQLSYSQFQNSQTGGQRYSDTCPFSIPWCKKCPRT